MGGGQQLTQKLNLINYISYNDLILDIISKEKKVIEKLLKILKIS